MISLYRLDADPKCNLTMSDMTFSNREGEIDTEPCWPGGELSERLQLWMFSSDWLRANYSRFRKHIVPVQIPTSFDDVEKTEWFKWALSEGESQHGSNKKREAFDANSLPANKRLKGVLIETSDATTAGPSRDGFNRAVRLVNRHRNSLPPTPSPASRSRTPPTLEDIDELDDLYSLEAVSE